MRTITPVDVHFAYNMLFVYLNYAAIALETVCLLGEAQTLCQLMLPHCSTQNTSPVHKAVRQFKKLKDLYL